MSECMSGWNEGSNSKHIDVPIAAWSVSSIKALTSRALSHMACLGPSSFPCQVHEMHESPISFPYHTTPTTPRPNLVTSGLYPNCSIQVSRVISSSTRLGLVMWKTLNPYVCSGTRARCSRRLCATDRDTPMYRTVPLSSCTAYTLALTLASAPLSLIIPFSSRYGT